MAKQIAIRNDLYARLEADKGDNKSFSDILTELYARKDQLLNQVTFNAEGRFVGSKGLAGKTIRYEVVE